MVYQVPEYAPAAPDRLLEKAVRLSLHDKLYRNKRGPRKDTWATTALLVLLALAACHLLLSRRTSHAKDVSATAGTGDEGGASKAHSSDIWSDMRAGLDKLLQEYGRSGDPAAEEGDAAKPPLDLDAIIHTDVSFFVRRLWVHLPPALLVALPSALALPALLAGTPAASVMLGALSIIFIVVALSLGFSAAAMLAAGWVLPAVTVALAAVTLWRSAGRMSQAGVRDADVEAIKAAGRVVGRQGWLIAACAVVLAGTRAPAALLLWRRLMSKGISVAPTYHFSAACQERLLMYGSSGVTHCCTWSLQSVAQRPTCLLALAAWLAGHWVTQLLTMHLVVYVVAHVATHDFLLRSQPPAGPKRGGGSGGRTTGSTSGGGTAEAEDDGMRRGATVWSDVLFRPLRHLFTTSFGTVVAAAGASVLFVSGPGVLKMVSPSEAGGALAFIHFILAMGCWGLSWVPLWVTMRAAVAGEGLAEARLAAGAGGFSAALSAAGQTTFDLVRLLAVLLVLASAILCVAFVAGLFVFLAAPLGDVTDGTGADIGPLLVVRRVMLHAMLLMASCACVGVFMAAAILCLLVVFLAHRECRVLCRAC